MLFNLRTNLRLFSVASGVAVTQPHKFLCVVLLATLVLGSAGDARATDSDIGAWTIFTTTDAFQTDAGPSRWHYWVDAQARYFDIGSGTNQYLVRPAIGYDLGNNVSVWLGYARFRSRNSAGNVTDENRYWQQLGWTAGNWAGGKVTMRTRLEERSLSTGDDVGVVLRFMTKYTRPLGDDGSKSLILSLEPFVDLKDTDWGGESGLGQNRTYIGIGWRLSDRLNVETGYMNQFIFADSGADRMNHLAVVNFKLKLGLGRPHQEME